MPKPLRVSHLEFDHSYCEDPGHRFWRRLQKLGFTPEPDGTEHPGGAVCRFIVLNEAKGADAQAYLEFVHLRGGGFSGMAGLSFRAPGGLEKFFAKIAGDLDLGAKLTHRNYDWEKGEAERRAGWNFVHFKRKTPRACNVWLTENEIPAAKRRRKRRIVKHPIGAVSVVGAQLDLTERDRTFFEALFRGKIRDAVVLACGTELRFTPAARTRLRALVLAAKDLDRVNRAKHGYTLACVGERPALRIAGANAKMWDLLLVQA